MQRGVGLLAPPPYASPVMASRSKKKRGELDPATLARLRGALPNAALRAGRADLGVIVGGTPYSSRSLGGIGFALDILDLDAAGDEPARIVTPFLPHGFSPHPTAPQRAAIFEKRGPGAGVV